jgi:hypothetical protein
MENMNELTEFIPENIDLAMFRSWELKGGEFDDYVEIRNAAFSRRLIASIVAMVAWITLILGVIITLILFVEIPELLPKPVIIIFACLAGLGVTGIIVVFSIIATSSNASLWKGDLRFRYDKSSGKIFFPREDTQYSRKEYDELILGTTDGYNTVRMLEQQPSSRNSKPPLIMETFFLVHRKDGTWRRHLVGYDDCSSTTRRAVTKIRESLPCQRVKRTMSFPECYATQHKSSEMPTPPKPTIPFFVYCFLSIFVIAGLVFLGFSIAELVHARASLSWSSCEGTVTHSEVERSNHEGVTYGVSIHYDYIVADQPYTSNQYCFSPFESSNSHSAMQIVAEHPVGSTVKVYYAPDSPEKSVLVPGPTRGVYFFLIFSLLFSLAPVGIIFLIRFLSNRNYLIKPYTPSEPVWE